jgi:hypothetical protein
MYDEKGSHYVPFFREDFHMCIILTHIVLVFNSQRGKTQYLERVTALKFQSELLHIVVFPAKTAPS